MCSDAVISGAEGRLVDVADDGAWCLVGTD